jgi:hypothetical protein
MKIIVKTIAILIALSAVATVTVAQGPKLRIDSLERLEEKAVKVVDISLDEKLMGLATRVLKKAEADDPDTRKVIEAIAGIKEIYVRSYEFDAEGVYLPADVDAIRSQVQGQGWSRLVGVRSKRAGENAEIFMLSQGQQVLGVTILVANPKELTVVNIVGSVDVERLSELDGNLGIPRIELQREPKTKP